MDLIGKNLDRMHLITYQYANEYNGVRCARSARAVRGLRGARAVRDIKSMRHEE